MTYGDNVGNENPDDLWMQEVGERNAASALHGLHTIHKSEQEHPSEHNGAAMQSEGERMGTLSMMRWFLIPAVVGAAMPIIGKKAYTRMTRGPLSPAEPPSGRHRIAMTKSANVGYVRRDDL